MAVGAVAVALTLLTCVISYRTIKGDPRDAWLREFALAFASWGGTSFYSATVTDADFTGATLKNCDLRAKSLIRTRFQKVNYKYIFYIHNHQYKDNLLYQEYNYLVQFLH
ncbi:MAG: pentapeptide repeat-containing protein [Crocosphaera sp.]